MGLSSFLLLALFLLPLVRGKSGQLVLLHFYPETGNFSYVELVCVVSASGHSPTVVTEAKFQLNRTDYIGQEESLDNGVIKLLLTQETEGYFTCSWNKSVSSNSVGLAGNHNTVEPPNNGQVGGEHFVHYSEVVPSSEVLPLSTLIHC